MSSSDVNSVEYNVIIQGQEATTSLNQISASVTSTAEKISALTTAIAESSAKWGTDISTTIALFKELDTATASSSMFGQGVQSVSGWSGVSASIQEYISNQQMAQQVAEQQAFAIDNLDARLAEQSVAYQGLVAAVDRYVTSSQYTAQAEEERIPVIEQLAVALENLRTAETQLAASGADEETQNAAFKDAADDFWNLAQAEDGVSVAGVKLVGGLQEVYNELQMLKEADAQVAQADKELADAQAQLNSDMQASIATGDSYSRDVIPPMIEGEDKFVDSTLVMQDGIVATDMDMDDMGATVLTNSKTFDDFANAEDDAGEEATVAAGGINILNTALGALTAMLVFQIINAITTTFTSAINYAQDYYQSLVQINIAQSAMAQAGVATTQQQLLDIAKQLSTTWTNISQVQMTQAVSQAALLTTQYGLTADQVKNIANDAALLVTTGKVTDLQTGIEDIIATMKGDTSSAKWAAEVGLNFTAADFQAEALKLGITAVNGAFTDQQRAIITLALNTDNLGKTQNQATASLNTAAQAGNTLSAQWSKALQAVGQAFEPVLYVMQSVLIPVIENYLIPAFGVLKDAVVGDMGIMTATFQTGFAIIDAISHGTSLNVVQYWKDAFNSVEAYLDAAANTGGINTAVNTPVNTGAGSTSPSVAVDTTKVEDTLDTVAKDYEDYYNTVEKDTQDYNNKIDDINSKENEDLLNESQDYRVKELQQEQDFEDKMENLQAEFELKLQGDLEDRDARKVLEDTAKYNLDVQTDNNENQIRMQQDQQNENLKMQQIKENADLERQQEQRDYQQQLQDAQTSLDQKLQDEAVALQKDKGLQKTSAEDIYEILKQYYGPGGYIEQLQEYSYLSSVAMNSRLLASLQQLAHSVSTGEGIQSTQTGSGRKYAAGGIELATSATNATFGEAGPELAMFLPLNQSSIAPTFTTGLASASSQNGGTFNIIVQMDDGLVANIVEDSMNATAEVIQRSNRSS